MSKYNVGDKFLIEIEEKYSGSNTSPLYRVKGFRSLIFDNNGLDKLEKYDGNDGATKYKVGDMVVYGWLKAVLLESMMFSRNWRVYTEKGSVEIWNEDYFKKLDKNVDVYNLLFQ